MRMQGEHAQLRPVLVMGRNQVAALFTAVKTKILDWALSLESEGILGDGLSFSEKERERPMTSHNISIQNFQGILCDVQHSTVQQSNTQTVTSGNFSSLAAHLASRGISEADINDLEKALTHDGDPKASKAFGPGVSAWIGRMISKADDGTWDVSVAVAGTLLADALTKFYGL